MSSLRRATLVALATSLLAPLLALPSRSDSQSVFSTRLAQLGAGARALERGEALDGIRLTEAALQQPLAPHDGAAAYSNLCAGYVMLGYLAAAIELCNRAQELDPSNWRIYNNRAAALLGRGRIDDAISDLRRALMIRPQAAIASQGLASALDQKRRGAVPEWLEVDI